ncbi:Two component system histidine kinase [Streptococcus sp. DD10]|uniref:hypothetical protein n=1 Tax=Streptococcus sp. DD10 TaxID=1777878 RepID=UPI000798D527|nr:hypothetical protein [Streptococcus sp. DD10]KXT74421.1 Two component system histidine kinase [Streptococcus sp. DD10]
MLRKLRIRFILIATLCSSLVIIGFSAALNITIYTQTSANIRTVLSVLTANDGELPITNDIEKDLTSQNIQAGSIYNFQYFSASATASNVTVNLGNIQSINEEVALEMTNNSLSSNNEYGTLIYNNRYFSYQLSQKKIVSSSSF